MTPPSQHLAQLNIARARYSLDDPRMADFVAAIDALNALAEASPGFVWRLQDEAGDATSLRPFGDDLIVNLSVWTDPDALHAYAFKSGHVDILRRRKAWFVRMEAAHAVLWWVPARHTPSLAEAKARLDHLRAHGATPHAFTFTERFAPPETA